MLHFLAHFNTILFTIYICSQENRGDLHRKGNEIHLFIISTVFSLLVIGFEIKKTENKYNSKWSHGQDSVFNVLILRDEGLCQPNGKSAH